MRFQTPLIPARLIRRYKRFLADARLEDGREITAHCANPGSMLGLAEPGTRIWLEPNDDPKKKLKFGWRLVDHENGHFTGVDTSVPNRALKSALQDHAVPGLPHYETLQAEVPYGEASRVDFLLTGPEGRTWVEVKSVTLSRTPGLAEFPDSRTARGARHLQELATRVDCGDRAIMLYLIQRTDCTGFRLAADLDPAYSRAASEARAHGVQTLCLDTRISPQGIEIGTPVPLV